ncbi:MAG: hypothetical protein WCF19_07770 [Chlamydiales bacterium]
MNVLGLVFSILMILSYSFYACWDKHVASSRLRNTYAAHQQASRKILNSYESEVYAKLGKKNSSTRKGRPPKEEVEPDDSEIEGQKEKKPDPNHPCARINLWPLIHEGRAAHPQLYDLAVKLIRTFYGALSSGEKHFESRFLDLLLASAKESLEETESFSLEKIVLIDPDFQRIYYKMLKGTKHWDLRGEIGYPPLLEYVKAEPSTDKICVFHAHPDLITVLFNEKLAWRLYGEIHRKGGPALTSALIERISAESHHISIDFKLIELLELGRPNHSGQKQTFVAEEGKGDVSLRKNIALSKV